MLDMYIMSNMNNKTPRKKHPIIGFQTHPDTVKKVDRLARAQGISRSDVLRIIIEKHFTQESLLDKVGTS